MTNTDFQDGIPADITPEMILAQLQLLTRDEIFRASKRSIAFLRFVVEETLKGSEDQIKERTIGMEVFGRSSSYDTNLDHIVRTAATELRKRLAIYYGDEKHRAELRIGLLPGSYIPRFMHAHQAIQEDAEDGVSNGTHFIPGQMQHSSMDSVANSHGESVLASNHKEYQRRNWLVAYLLFAVVLAAGLSGWYWLHSQTPEYLFWKPVLETPGPVLLAVGDVPHGPPQPMATEENQNSPLAIPQSDSTRSVPFADAVTIAKVVGVLESNGKKVLIRRENASSFSDLREGPVVLVGAFNNEWSLRLTRQLRFTLALDAENHLIYIKDGKNPSSRAWSWGTNQPLDYVGGRGGPVLYDYALISRIRNSETGHVLVVIGGLYTYGTQSAGEFLTDPQLMQSIGKVTRLGASNQNLQIVLGTTVTDGTPGPPRVLAVSQE
ncbi:MAG: hypothetical protein ABSC77_12105 [Terracidiphilus sp.]|jgi:hypothetical protein